MIQPYAGDRQGSAPGALPFPKLKLTLLHLCHVPASLANTADLCALLSEEGNRKAYDMGRYKAGEKGQYSVSWRKLWTPTVSLVLKHLKKRIDKAAEESTNEDTVLSCAMHVGLRRMYADDHVRAFLTLRAKFEDSTIATDEAIVNEHQLGIIVRALNNFALNLDTTGVNRTLNAPAFVKDEISKLGQLGLDTNRLAFLAVLQAFDLQPTDGQHAGQRRRIHSWLEDFYGNIRARVGFIHGGLKEFGVYDAYMELVKEEREQ